MIRIKACCIKKITLFFWITLILNLILISSSYSDTVNENTDTTVNATVNLQGDIKENRTYNITNDAVYTINAPIQSSSYLITKTGNGTLVFADDNISLFSAGVIVTEGTVAVSDDNTLGSGTVTLNGGKLSSNNLVARNLNNTITIQSSSELGDATNYGALTLSGNISFSSSDLTLSSGSNNTLSGTVGLNSANQTFNINNSVTQTISGIVSSGALTKSGSGVLILSGTNTYTGDTNISAGTLNVSGTGQLNSGNYTGDIDNSGALIYSSSSNQTLTGGISGTGTLTKSGSSTLTLSGTNGYTGVTTINNGTLTLNGSLSNSTAITVASGATLDINSSDTVGSIAGAGTIDITSKEVLTVGNDNSSTVFSGTIQSDGGVGTGAITKVGTGSLTLSGNNTFGGAVNVNAGSLIISSNNALGDTNNQTTVASGAIIDFQNVNYSTAETLRNSGTISTSTGTSSFAGSITLLANSIVDVDGTQLTLSGSITDSGERNLTKDGTGILVLSGSNNYSGDTLITAGTLKLTGSLSNSTDVTINSGASLDLQATQTIASLDLNGTITRSAGTSALTVSGTSDLGGNVTTSGSQTYTGATTLSASNTLTTTNSNISFGNTINSDGTARNLTISSGTGITQFAGIVGGSSGVGDIDITGALDLNAAIANASSIAVSGTSNIGADVTTSGTQTYSGATTFSASSTLTGSTVNFGSTVDGGNNNIIVSGNADIDGAITNTAALSVQGVGSTSNIGADITTTGVQFLGNATLSGTGDRTVTSTGGSNITFYGITGASKGLTVDGGFQLSTNDATGLASLSVTGASTLAANVTSTGVQNYQSATTLGANNTLTTTNSNITFGGAIDSDGTSRNLTINMGAGTTQFAGVVGGTNAIGAIDVTGALDLNAAIANAASLDVSGTSNIGADVTTTGTQSYSGTTTLSGGDRTLQGSTITMAAVTGTGSHDLTVTGNLDLDGAVTNVVELDITGTSNLGANVTTSGTQNYQGATTLSSGDRTLTASTVTLSAVTGGSNALTVTGNLDLNGAVSGVTNMSVSGTSNIGADVTTTGTQSYTGTTTVSASSTLIGTEISAAAIALNDDLEIRNSSDSTLTSVISGTGALTKSGSGALTLRGVNTFDGDLTVSAGTLFAGLAADSGNQVIENNVIVSGGTLSGGATIGGNVTVATANLAPGNSIGILTIDGNVTLGDNSTTTIEFNDTSSDKIVVSGNITLAGALVLEPANTTYSDATFTIFDGSGGSGNSLTGTFASTTVNNSSNLGDATTSISYDTVNRKVFLNIDEDGGVSSNTVKSLTTKNNFKDIAEVFDAATTGKTLEVANVLKASDSNSVNTELGKLKGTVLASTFSQPVLNHGNFNKALSSVTSSNVNTSLVSSFTNNTSELTLASLQDAGLYGDKNNFKEYFDYSDTSVLGFIKNNKNKSILSDFQSPDSASFIRTYGTTADRDNINSNYTGYDSETTGILFGQQFKNDEETFTGYSYGFTGTDTDYKNNYGESKTYSAHASLFKQFDKKDHGLNLISGMYVSKTESERNVNVFGTSVNDKYVSDYWDVGINQEVQYIQKYKFGELSISPSAKFNSTYVFKSDTKETGGELALNVDNDNLFVVKPEIGISIGANLSKKESINNELSLAMFVSQEHFIDGTTSNARFSSGSSFNVDLPRDQETYYSLGLGYNFLNKETDTSLMANAFLMQNEQSDMNSNIFSLTFRKLFGDFAKGNVPPVIAKRPENNKEVIKVVLPENDNDMKTVEKNLEEFEENIEIVLKENPTEKEVAKVYESVSNNSKVKKQLTLNDVYNNLTANCYAIENKLVYLVNYYNKNQLYKILDKCNQLSDPKVHLIANRLHQIQLDETTAIQKLYYKYLRILSYVPFLTFVAFIILAYEFIRRYIVNHFRSKRII